jgi:hypothetical protein
MREAAGTRPRSEMLRVADMPKPVPGPGERILIKGLCTETARGVHAMSTSGVGSSRRDSHPAGRQVGEEGCNHELAFACCRGEQDA